MYICSTVYFFQTEWSRAILLWASSLEWALRCLERNAGPVWLSFARRQTLQKYHLTSQHPSYSSGDFPFISKTVLCKWLCFLLCILFKALRPMLLKNNLITVIFIYRSESTFPNPVVHGAMGLRPKMFQTSVAVPPAPVRVPSQRPLATSARQSRRSLMIRMIMKWSWVLCTDLLAFALQLRKTPENLS